MDLGNLLIWRENAQSLNLHNQIAQLFQSCNVVLLRAVDVVVITHALDLNLVEGFGYLSFIRILDLVAVLDYGFGFHFYSFLANDISD